MRVIKDIPKLPERPSDSHKGMFGRVCIVAGNFGMSGAAALTGRSALRAGAGLVRVAIPRSVLPIVAAIEPSFTTIPLEEDDKGRIGTEAIKTLVKAANDNDAMAVGPGLGVSSQLRQLMQALIEQKDLPLVIDADGLNNLCKLKNWPEQAGAKIILTPHPGEFKSLWKGLFRKAIPADRRKQAVELASRTGTVVVLKGAGTVVSDGERVYVNRTGNPGMSTAGSGDCLTGIIPALAGQGMELFDAAVLGTYVHGLAGDIAAQRTGQISLMVTDIIESLCEAFKRC